jgi:hypothetical protein
MGGSGACLLALVLSGLRPGPAVVGCGPLLCLGGLFLR